MKGIEILLESSTNVHLCIVRLVKSSVSLKMLDTLRSDPINGSVRFHCSGYLGNATVTDVHATGGGEIFGMRHSVIVNCIAYGIWILNQY